LTNGLSRFGMSVPRLGLTWGEVGGALGDLGVLLPLAAALIAVNGLSATSLFFGVGLAYILSGLTYRLPVPIQPLKAVSAIAIAHRLSSGVVIAAGWWMGLILLLLVITDSARWLSRFFTQPIIRGIQLGVALLLVRSGLLLVSRREIVPGGVERVIHLAPGPVPLGWLLAGVSVLLLLWALRHRRWTASLIVLCFGVVVAVTLGGVMDGLGEIRLGLSLPRPILPGLSDLSTAFVLLVVPQIPLTLGNAVFATADTARAYFGEDARRVTPRALLKTMSISQIVCALFGGVGVCHGSGGLTAHYKLGARTGLAPVLMGGLCLALALLLDGNVLPMLALIPYPVLGTLVVFVGVQHGLLVRDLRGWENGAVAAITAGVGFATRNLALGFGCGIVLEHSLRMSRRIWARRTTAL
jgi:SulP family sulfate permease